MRLHVVVVVASWVLRLCITYMVLVVYDSSTMCGGVDAAETSRGNFGRLATWDDLAAVPYLKSAAISPLADCLLYTVQNIDVENNKVVQKAYIVRASDDSNGDSASLERTRLEGVPKPFPDGDTVDIKGAAWSPDGSSIAYIRNGQVWVAEDVAHLGTSSIPWQLTYSKENIVSFKWAPNGKSLGLLIRAFPENPTDDAYTAKQRKKKEESKVKAVVTETLMFRHFDHYADGTLQYLFAIDVRPGAVPKLLTPHIVQDVDSFDWHPDGISVVYASKAVGREAAWSTYHAIYLVDVKDTTVSPQEISSSRGTNSNPAFAPNGKFIVYLSMERPGFESDQNRIFVYDLTQKSSFRIGQDFPLSADKVLIGPDSAHIYIQAVHHMHSKIFVLTSHHGSWASRAQEFIAPSSFSVRDLSVDKATKVATWIQDAVHAPPEVYLAPLSNSGTSLNIQPGYRLTRVAPETVSAWASPATEYWFDLGDGETRIQGFLVKPPAQYLQNLERLNKKVPLLNVIHGGPQSALLNGWGQRWNIAAFSNIGVAVSCISFHGTPGYTQDFTDSISQNWGGAAATDIIASVDYLLQKHDWLDKDRVAAAGGSFGGYMTNWLATQYPDRFAAFFTHAGVWSLDTPAATDELWFTIWEYGSLYAARNSDFAAKFSPSHYAENLKKPHLIVHGELDYRCPLDAAVELFGILQYRGIPSKLIIYPDEGHWILKPQNSQLWYDSVQSWFRKHLNISEEDVTFVVEREAMKQPTKQCAVEGELSVLTVQTDEL